MPSYTHEEATNAFRLPAERDIRRTKTLNVRIEDPANADRERKLKHEQLRQYFHSTFEIYEKVFEPLASDEAFTIPPVHKLRHPLIFYLGHTATFYMNKLCLAGLTTRIDHFFEETFAIGVDEMSWDDLNEAHYNWPTVQAVWNYRRAVRERVDSLFREYNFDLPLTFDKSTESKHDAFYWAVLMGCEHERIHLETASVHVRELPMRLVNPSAFWEPCAEEGEVPKGVLPMIEFPGGKVKVGRDRDSEVYGWDCDYADNLVMDVAPFKASEHIISNFEFYEFIKEGGYTNREFWDEEGWNWVSWKHPEHPWFWVKTDDGFRLRCQTVEIDMKWSWPCEVNNLEAYAYLQWLGKKLGKPLRMPTEAEWLHMRDVCLGTKGSDQHEWAVAPGNINLEHHCSSCPVKKYKQGKLYDVIGNVWQHCETSVYPYEGFKVHPLYDDFSMPTFDGRHRCMKGGTWISTGNEATRDARFAFRRHFFQFIGIRVIEGEPVDETRHTKNVLGMDPPVDLAAHCSYTPLPDGSDAKDVYPKVLADLAVATYKRHAESKPANRALDLLCGAGRASYELSLTFKQVLGVDFSCRLLQPAYAMRERGMTPYSFVTDSATGERKAALAEAKDFEWRGRREDVVFYQSDPANLHAHIKDFDLILAFNITDQNTAYNPRAVPAHLVSRLTAGGILVVAEPKIKARNTSAPSTAEYMKLLAEAGAEVVEAPVTVPLYFPETQTAGRTLEFDVFAVRRK